MPKSTIFSPTLFVDKAGLLKEENEISDFYNFVIKEATSTPINKSVAVLKN